MNKNPHKYFFVSTLSEEAVCLVAIETKQIDQNGNTGTWENTHAKFVEKKERNGLKNN